MTTQTTTYIEQFIRQLCQAIYHSLDTSCGRQLQPVEPLKDFWTEDMQKAYEYRERCYRKWRKAQGLSKLKYWLKHQEARAALRRLIQKKRKENWEHFCQQLTSSQYAKAIAKFSRIRKRRTISPTFSTMEGPKHSADTMARHLENVYSKEATQGMQRSEISSDSLPFEFVCPIALTNILSVIQSLPSNNASGVDHLSKYENDMPRYYKDYFQRTLEESDHLFEFCGFKSVPFRSHDYQGRQRANDEMANIFIDGGEEYNKRKGNRQGEAEGEENQEDLKSIKNKRNIWKRGYCEKCIKKEGYPSLVAHRI
ncbi:hypothetical protein G6F46_006056 [Rhizopus delemar]|uniref:Uncharacterized protein n=2 Tax=Rhizopus TaxID=4842 RepID=A0A9P6ZAN3_9FUNG|nr:hypothetical protein G6F55_005529 [Rhizopus delemar]KAG1543934.1 hypothetical protein G6F51_006372 [Rhizopus arrhizus]KAG1497197.1 hypothetical protein G6F54_005930 [Rhizopus delemar]KAG1511036.1 hypothetical protein G6F53_006235 [Rhizopus delemar]KAG1524235.1 hypothetical protein G6F52_004357 [Rhizopus delemar]